MAGSVRAWVVVAVAVCTMLGGDLAEAQECVTCRTDACKDSVWLPPCGSRGAKAWRSRPRTKSSPAPQAFAAPAADQAPPGMALVPAGLFFMGCNAAVDSECNGNEKPGRTVSVEAFAIDLTEVTTEAYSRCMTAGACMASSEGPYCNAGKAGRGLHPINCVDWSQAVGYCAWLGKRLPTEAEWEKAARGTDGRKFPWGNVGFGATKVANICDSTCKAAHPEANFFIRSYDDGFAETAPVGSFPEGRSPYGLFDVSGNVWEWVSDWYKGGEARVVRGGSWSYDARNARASSRALNPPARHSVNIGFRCAQ